MTHLIFLASSDPLSHVVPHTVFTLRVGGYALNVSNHMLMVVVSGLLVFLVFTWLGATVKRSPVPTGLRNFFEAIVSFLRTEVFRPALGENADRFAPFLWTVFFFILFCNVLGMIPLGEILTITSGGLLRHMWGTATGGLIVTASLALVAFCMIHLSGVIQQVRIQMDPTLDPHYHGHDHAAPHGHGGTLGGKGLEDAAHVHLHAHAHAHALPAPKPFVLALPIGIGRYVWNFAPHPDVGMAPVNFLLFVFLLVLESFGALVKPFALCVRLFANMLAGHLLLGVLVGLIPVGLAGAATAATFGIGIPVVLGATVLSLLEVLVAFLQAYIFTFLTTLFIASAVAPEH